MPLVVTCTCGHVAPAIDFKLVGWQEVGEHEWARMAQCPQCHSTVCTQVVDNRTADRWTRAQIAYAEMVQAGVDFVAEE